MPPHRLVLGVLPGACAVSPGSGPSVSPAAASPSPWPPDDAASGIDDAVVGELFRREWTAPLELELEPEVATTRGIQRFDDRLEENGREGIARKRGTWRELPDEAPTLLGRGDLGTSDRTSLELLIESLDASVTSEVCTVPNAEKSKGRRLAAPLPRAAGAGPILARNEGMSLLRYGGCPLQVSP